MKSVLKKIAFLLNYLMCFRTIYRFKKINRKLYNKLEEREVDRIILKGKIIKMVRKYLNIGANSKYIPIDNRNTTEIRERVLAEFGEQMQTLDIKINSKLELV